MVNNRFENLRKQGIDSTYANFLLLKLGVSFNLSIKGAGEGAGAGVGAGDGAGEDEDGVTMMIELDSLEDKMGQSSVGGILSNTAYLMENSNGTSVEALTLTNVWNVVVFTRSRNGIVTGKMVLLASMETLADIFWKEGELLN